MNVFVLGTGSSGNCLVVEAEGERMLVDAGMGPNRAVTRMRALGSELVTARGALGLVVTHEHGDHAAHASPLSRALRAKLFAHDAASLEEARRRGPVFSYSPGRPLALGPFVVETLPVPHDAPHVAVRITAGRARVGVATDLGQARRDLRAFLGACDLVFLESNYCPRLLESGPYPTRLKRRVGGPLGHLANEQAGMVAAELEDSRVSRLVLVHLSRVNNSPERAHAAVASRVRRLPIEVLEQGEARRFEVTGGARRAEQLAFAF